MCVTDRHDMTLAVKVALNPNTTNQPSTVTYKGVAILQFTLTLSQTSPGFYVSAV